jgi:hypothetical protein
LKKERGVFIEDRPELCAPAALGVELRPFYELLPRRAAWREHRFSGHIRPMLHVINVFIMARQYDTWVAQASGSVLLGTFVSVVTLTTTMWLVKTGTLPVTLLR